jgi:UrcA family protein
MKIITAVAAVAAIVVSSLNVAAAVAGPAPVEARISYADLDLGAPEGQQLLEKRIKAAARSACGVNPSERYPELARSSARCYRSVVAGGMEQAARINPTIVASR